MTQITILYNPFLPELKISVDGQRLSPYSALAAWRSRRLETWCDDLFPALYREINTEYEVLCLSTDFACQWLEELAERYPYCRAFSSGPLPLSASVYERLERLELLGAERRDVVIPVIDASGDDGMVGAFYEILAEQSPFASETEDGIMWPDCPLAAVTLRTYAVWDRLPEDAPAALFLCASEEDNVPADTEVPACALVMGAETRYLGRRLGKAFFSADPDRLGDLLLDILAEAALCPLLSRLSSQFPEAVQARLTPREREELALVCQAAPVCRVQLPRVLDAGRSVELVPAFLPSDSSQTIRIVSDQPSIIGVSGRTLCPRQAGTAEVAVFAGDDPYPVTEAPVTVRRRVLIGSLSLFPSSFVMPEGGTAQLSVSVLPEDGENMEEIQWESSAPEIAAADPVTGLISARRSGVCTITASTPEASGHASLLVQPPMEDILCPCGQMELAVGSQKEWRFRVQPENAYGADMLRVTSSDRGVAEYRGGYILGRGAGRCVIRVSEPLGGLSRELQVTVQKRGR